MFTRIVTTAVFAGFLTGLVAAVLQFWQVQPILLHAELYEDGTLVHFGAGATGATAHPELPGLELVRDGLSVLFTALNYTAYALILTAVVALASDRGWMEITARQGVILGVAGFAAVQMAPAMGLPPELPGVAAPEVGVRQVWWYGCVAATGLGLGLFAFSRNVAFWVAGVVLIALPHLIGAPEPDTFAGPTPPEVAAHFASRALGVGLAVWAILGTLVGYFWSREA